MKSLKTILTLAIAGLMLAGTLAGSVTSKKVTSANAAISDGGDPMPTCRPGTPNCR